MHQNTHFDHPKINKNLDSGTASFQGHTLLHIPDPILSTPAAPRFSAYSSLNTPLTIAYFIEIIYQQ